ncbi:hypothetical protein JCM10207_005226 [Rhodosporidiobolus poonsookiae]
MADADSSRPATALESARLLAPLIAGAQAALGLYGVYVVLHGRYVASSLYRTAIVPVKVTVWLVFALLTLYIGLMVAEIMVWTITTDRSFGSLNSGFVFEMYIPVASTWVAAVVQVFLMIRCAALLRARPLRYVFLTLTSAVILLALTSCMLSFANLELYFKGKGSFLENYNILNSMWIAGNAAVDVAISVTLAITLQKQIAGFNARTDGILRSLVRTTLRTASYTAVLAVISAILFGAYSDDSDYHTVAFAFWYPVPCCYGLSLYTTLSTRRILKGKYDSSLPTQAPRPMQVPSARSTPLDYTGSSTRPSMHRSATKTPMVYRVDVDGDDISEKEEDGRKRERDAAHLEVSDAAHGV